MFFFFVFLGTPLTFKEGKYRVHKVISLHGTKVSKVTEQDGKHNTKVSGQRPSVGSGDGGGSGGGGGHRHRRSMDTGKRTFFD